MSVLKPHHNKTQQHDLYNNRCAALVNSSNDAIVSIDQDENIVLFNTAAQKLFGYDEIEVLGQPLTLLIPKKFHHVHKQHIAQFNRASVSGRRMQDSNRVYGVHKEGNEFPVEVSISRFYVEGKINYAAIVRDITEKAKVFDDLQDKAAKDHITGLLNRAEFEAVGQQLFVAAKVGKGPFSLLMLDIDDFKKINDTCGHDRGDEALKLLASVGNQSVRKLDVFARVGGEEFVILMPETNVAEAKMIAERIRTMFDNQSYDYQWVGKPIFFTVSIGVATLESTDHDMHFILKRADDALYEAKRSGKNKVCLAD